MKLTSQKEVQDLKLSLESLERDNLHLQNQLRTQQSSKEVRISEMASAIRSLSSRSDIHGLLANAKQDLEAEKLTSFHLRSELDAYRQVDLSM